MSGKVLLLQTVVIVLLTAILIILTAKPGRSSATCRVDYVNRGRYYNNCPVDAVATGAEYLGGTFFMTVSCKQPVVVCE